MPDSLWTLLEKVLNVYDPLANTGSKRCDPCQAFDGIIEPSDFRPDPPP